MSIFINIFIHPIKRGNIFIWMLQINQNHCLKSKQTKVKDKTQIDEMQQVWMTIKSKHRNEFYVPK
jgi:hypothetical protein